MDQLLIGVTFLETIYAVWFLLFFPASLLLVGYTILCYCHGIPSSLLFIVDAFPKSTVYHKHFSCKFLSFSFGVLFPTGDSHHLHCLAVWCPFLLSNSSCAIWSFMLSSSCAPLSIFCFLETSMSSVHFFWQLVWHLTTFNNLDSW